MTATHQIVRLAWPALVAILFMIAGCGSQERVTGKVTLDGSPVTGGMVTFIGEDKREKSATISSDGEYCIDDLEQGNFKVTVCNFSTALPMMRVGAPAGADLHGLPAPPPPQQSLPRRYARRDNGLTFIATGGRQRFDINLTP
jgi:hypothetical protein